MTMLTSAEAINAELEYRREQVRLTSRPVRMRRSARRERARRAEQARQAGQTRRRQVDGAGRDDQPGSATVPAQRTSERNTTTRQPA